MAQKSMILTFDNPHNPGSVITPERGYVYIGVAAIVLYGFISLLVGLVSFLLLDVLFGNILGGLIQGWVALGITAIFFIMLLRSYFADPTNYFEIPPGNVGVPQIFRRPISWFLFSPGRHLKIKGVLDAVARPITSKGEQVTITDVISNDGALMETRINFLVTEFDPFTIMQIEKNDPDIKTEILKGFSDGATRIVLTRKTWREAALTDKVRTMKELSDAITEQMEKDAEDIVKDNEVIFRKFGISIKLSNIQEILPKDQKLRDTITQYPIEEEERKYQLYEAETFLRVKGRLMEGLKDKDGKILVPGLSAKDAEEQAQRTLKQRSSTNETFFNLNLPPPLTRMAEKIISKGK